MDVDECPIRPCTCSIAQPDSLSSAPPRLRISWKLGGLSPLMPVASRASRNAQVTTYDGAQMRAIGILGGSVPYNVWVRAGRVTEQAPNLPLAEAVV